MATWYCLMDGQQFGPFSSDQLRGLAQTGRLKPEDQVRREDGSSWSLAFKVRGLFDALPASPTEAIPTAIPLPTATAIPVAQPVAIPIAPPPALPLPPAIASPTAAHRGSGIAPRGKSANPTYTVVGGVAAALLVLVVGMAFVLGRPWRETTKTADASFTDAPVSLAAETDIEADPSSPRAAARDGPPSAGAAQRVPQVSRWLEAGKQRRIVRDVMKLHVSAVWWSEEAETRALVVEVEIENLSSTRMLEYRGWAGPAEGGGEPAVIFSGQAARRIAAQLPAAGRSNATGTRRLTPGEVLRQQLYFPLGASGVEEPLRMVLPYAALAQSGFVGFEVPVVSILAEPPVATNGWGEPPASTPDAPSAAEATESRDAEGPDRVATESEPESIEALRRSIEANRGKREDPGEHQPGGQESW